MVDHTKYLCSWDSFFLFSFEQMPFAQPRLYAQVTISNAKDMPANKPLHMTSVCPKIIVTIFFALHAL